jgi:hypothetical protein
MNMAHSSSVSVTLRFKNSLLLVSSLNRVKMRLRPRKRFKLKVVSEFRMRMNPVQSNKHSILYIDDDERKLRRQKASESDS